MLNPNFCLFFPPGTEFVVVEDSSCLDTNAIILKGTTVLTYKPRLLDRPFSGSLAGIEVMPWTSMILQYPWWHKRKSCFDCMNLNFFVFCSSRLGILMSAGQRAGNSLVHHWSCQCANGALWQPNVPEQFRAPRCLQHRGFSTSLRGQYWVKLSHMSGLSHKCKIQDFVSPTDPVSCSRHPSFLQWCAAFPGNSKVHSHHRIY